MGIIFKKLSPDTAAVLDRHPLKTVVASFATLLAAVAAALKAMFENASQGHTVASCVGVYLITFVLAALVLSRAMPSLRSVPQLRELARMLWLGGALLAASLIVAVLEIGRLSLPFTLAIVGMALFSFGLLYVAHLLAPENKETDSR